MLHKRLNCVVVILTAIILSQTGILSYAGYRIEYQYDNLDRLTKVIHPDGETVSYEYDPVGNRIRKVVDVNVVNIPPTILSFIVEDGQIQRSMVKKLSAQFSESVNIPSDALDITGITQGSINVGTADFEYNSVNKTAIWTFAETLPDDVYTATFDADKITDLRGAKLDGNKDGNGGDSAVFTFHRLYGDASGNAVVNLIDFSIFASRWLTTPADTGLDIINASGDLPEPSDPNWSTYIGGSSADAGWYHGMAVDNNGNAFVAGYTSSNNFSNAVNTFHGSDDAFVAKIEADGSVPWAIYLGGSSADQALGVATDNLGNVFVTGYTTSSDFAGAINDYFGGNDAFVAKISPAGSLVWAYYLGGSGMDSGTGLALDNSGNIFITGSTKSGNFTGVLNTHHGTSVPDAFLSKITSAGLVDWTLYIGGTASDGGENIAFDESGNLVVVGSTNSSDLDAASNSYSGSAYDAFVCKVSQTGMINWSTYIGGNFNDFGFGIATDTSGNSFLTGPTHSSDLAGVTNTYYGGDYDAFITKITTAGSIVWSIYVGGSADYATLFL